MVLSATLSPIQWAKRKLPFVIKREESRNEKVHLVPDPAAGDSELRAEAKVADDVKKPPEDLLLLLCELHGLPHHYAPQLLLR